MRDDVALAQVVAQNLHQAAHHVFLPDALHLPAVRAGYRYHREEHRRPQTLDVADLQIENFLEHREIADKRALLPAVLIELAADGFEVELDVFARLDDLVVKLHQLAARLHVQVVVMQVHDLFVLRLGLGRVVAPEQRAHQLDVDAVVKRLSLQRASADADDLPLVLVPPALLEQVDIVVYAGDILVVQRHRAGIRPLVQLALLQQRAAVERHHPAIGLALALAVAHVGQAGKDVLQLVEIDGHLRRTFPVIRAAVGDDAVAQLRRNLAKQRAHPADERFERVFGVGHVFIVPEGGEQAAVGNRLPPVRNQVFDQRHPFFGFVDHVIGLPLVEVDDKFIHHLNPDGFAHGYPPSASEPLSQHIRIDGV